MIEWIYDEPEVDAGTTILAQFIFLVSDSKYMGLLRREHTDYGPRWCDLSINIGRYWKDDEIEIRAHSIVNEPEPPVKPQDCPFCKVPMRLCNYAGSDGDEVFWFVCDTKKCAWQSPERPTEEEAIELLNSIEVRRK
jgi:hypothetical protein